MPKTRPKKIDSSLDSIERVGGKLSYTDFKEFLKQVADAFPSGTEEYEFLSDLLMAAKTDVVFVRELFGLLEETPKVTDDDAYGFSWELMSPSDKGRSIFKKMEEMDPTSATDLYEFMSYVYMNYTSGVEDGDAGEGVEDIPDEVDAGPEEAPPPVDEPPPEFRAADVVDASPPPPLEDAPRGEDEEAEEDERKRKEEVGQAATPEAPQFLHSLAEVIEVTSLEQLATYVPNAFGLNEARFDAYTAEGAIRIIKTSDGKVLAYHPGPGFVQIDQADGTAISVDQAKEFIGEAEWAGVEQAMPEFAPAPQAKAVDKDDIEAEKVEEKQADFLKKPVEEAIDPAFASKQPVQSADAMSEMALVKQLMLATGYLPNLRANGFSVYQLSDEIQHLDVESPDAAIRLFDDAYTLFKSIPDTSLKGSGCRFESTQKLADAISHVLRKQGIHQERVLSPKDDAAEARIQKILAHVKIGSMVEARRPGAHKALTETGLVLDINRKADLFASTAKIRWSDRAISEIPVKDIQRLLMSALAETAVDLVLISHAKEINGIVSFTVTGFRNDGKNALAEVYSGRADLPKDKLIEAKVTVRTRLYSGAKMKALLSQIATIGGPEGQLIAQKVRRFGKTFVTERAAVIVRSSPYGMFAVKVPVVYVKASKRYHLFKKIGSAYVSAAGHRFRTVMAAKYGKPEYLMVASNAKAYFGTKGKITCNALSILEKTQFILQRKVVRNAIVAQQRQNEILAAEKDKAVGQIASAQAAQKAAESKASNAEKQASVLSARLVEARQIAETDPDLDLEQIASKERADANIARLTRLMGRGR